MNKEQAQIATDCEDRGFRYLIATLMGIPLTLTSSFIGAVAPPSVTRTVVCMSFTLVGVGVAAGFFTAMCLNFRRCNKIRRG